MKDMSVDKLSSLLTRKTASLLQNDFDPHRQSLNRQIRGSRILVIGGAGNIGSSTVRVLCEFKPSVLHVVDENENDLAELVRYVLDEANSLPCTGFRTFPLDFGSSLMIRFLSEAPAYDFVLNFAALKHVRSERDTHSLL